MGASAEIETLPGYLPTLAEKPLTEFRRAAEICAPGHEIREDDHHTGGSTDLGDVQHVMPVYTFKTGGVSGGLHQADFAVDDEETAYIITAKIFALTTYGFLKNGAVRSRELAENYKPRFASSAEYAEFMKKFDSRESFS